ncbi:MAG: aromatic ring-hydroxylating dioxygenase subunit alpha [Acidimicrobiaceae bacterium]|nr:aromatic ring-hydroxylating dioxygenase subunit alpha [Acidimicrobiaceae bacterium]MXW77339.1 aromatic ring-hydroxylating dioxygenase subunit alpha [Acidimicrobiaceae bacterium]MYC43623.1 aromatic ring-hydroxylating dioxygenase subunit alpha [Acidimicrobiaceae bacterium]MYD06496.1 aromatic ring-hydroxylating dioxygenase subunit alpha [Acidimicrobiaceae bacterium]MYH87256.1 aromatic ring-hydroxylating dioxygenase subunit alpha [Acidimicrobiaceae bacterium]
MTITTPDVHTNNAPVGETIVSVGRVSKPVQVDASRYTEVAWAQIEEERLWPTTWQLACTLDHVSEPGDVHVYDVGRLSIVIVRGDDGELRAFQNVCRHRGMQLCNENQRGLTELRCVFHRWSWNLAGELREVPSRKGFGALRNDDFPLFSASVDTWGPLVFVNPDPDAEPLADFLAPVPEDIAWADLDDFRCKALISIPVPSNWKTIIDGFSESYHVQGIHPEMLRMVDDVNSPQTIWERHGKLVQPYGLASPRLRGGATDQEIWDGFVEVMGGRVGLSEPADAGVCPEVPPGSTLREVLSDMIVDHFRDTEGVDLSRYGPDEMMTMQQYNLFPNITVLVFGDLLQVVRARPGATPDDGYMDIIAFDRVNPDAARREPLTAEMEPGSYSLGLVLDQDVTNLGRAQRGLHAPGLTHLTLSGEECRIINLHRNLDRVTGCDSGLELSYVD